MITFHRSDKGFANVAFMPRYHVFRFGVRSYVDINRQYIVNNAFLILISYLSVCHIIYCYDVIIGQYFKMTYC